MHMKAFKRPSCWVVNIPTRPVPVIGQKPFDITHVLLSSTGVSHYTCPESDRYFRQEGGAC